MNLRQDIFPNVLTSNIKISIQQKVFETYMEEKRSVQHSVCKLDLGPPPTEEPDYPFITRSLDHPVRPQLATCKLTNKQTKLVVPPFCQEEETRCLRVSM